MATTESLCRLDDLPGVCARIDEPMSHHTPLRLGGPAEVWATVDDVDALQGLLRLARKEQIRWRVHWPFCDWIVRNGGLAGLVIRPGRGFEHILVEDDHVRLGGATPWAALSGLGPEGWWSTAAHWPGTPGATFALGSEACLGGICREIRWIRRGGIETVEIEPGVPPPAIPESAVLFDILLGPGLTARGPTPPPRPAGWLFSLPPEVDGPDGDLPHLLRRVGICGTRLRQWQMSQSEPGTIVQLGGGSLEDLQLLTKGIRTHVEHSRGIQLQGRIPVMGRTQEPRGGP